MKRAMSVADVYKASFDVVQLPEEWSACIGDPVLNGSWLIWGESANGKTTFTLQLIKELCKLPGVRAAYNSLEEGGSYTMQKAFRRVNMIEVGGELILISESIDDLIERLKKRRSPNVIVIDSVQYTGLNYSAYKALKDLFPNKLFIFISHADGKKPAGRVASSIRYDAHIKIFVEGYKAFANGRYGGGNPYTIYQYGAEQYWGKID